MKKAIAFLMAVLTLLSLCACGSNGTDLTVPATTKAPVALSTEAPAGDAETNENASGEVIIEGAFEGPTLICSAGQSADVQMVQVMFQQSGLPFTTEAVATTDHFADNKTMVVAIGGSSKGLGAAGIDADQELERVKELLSEAKKAGIKIIACHIGGSGRRGKLGDRYIEPAVAMADYCVFVAGGNTDNYLSDCADKYGVPYTLVSEMVECTAVFKNLYK